MARDYIKITQSAPNTPGAGLLLSYISSLRQAYEQGVKVLAIMGHNNDGTVFTDIETIFGLPTGKGQTVFNLINGSVGSMTGAFQVADAKNLTETVGG
jgi:hypothetical protein